jgi:hypothetical protein
MPSAMAVPTSINMGVYLVQERSRWNDVLQRLQARVTFEIVTPFGKVRKIVEFTAVDLVALAAEIAAWAGAVGKQNSVPLYHGLPTDGLDYLPENSGAFMANPFYATGPGEGETEPPPYEYIPEEPPE